MSPEGIGDAEVAALSEDLHRAVMTFARVVRSRCGTPASAQAETLAMLEQAGNVNVAALAERRRVKHQTMRMVVTQLEEAGLVMRTPDPADRRSQLVALSPAGRAALAHDRHRRAAGIAAMIANHLTPQERGTLRAAICLIDRMTAEHA